MRRTILLLVTASVLVLALSTVALAASPLDIYTDYATHGKLTVDYSTADLQAYLGDAATIEYADQTKLADLNLLVQQILNQRSQGDQQTFPLTGGELLVGFLGGLALIAGGYGLHRTAKRK